MPTFDDERQATADLWAAISAGDEALALSAIGRGADCVSPRPQGQDKAAQKAFERPVFEATRFFDTALFSPTSTDPSPLLLCAWLGQAAPLREMLARLPVEDEPAQIEKRREKTERALAFCLGSFWAAEPAAIARQFQACDALLSALSEAPWLRTDSTWLADLAKKMSHGAKSELGVAAPWGWLAKNGAFSSVCGRALEFSATFTRSQLSLGNAQSVAAALIAAPAAILPQLQKLKLSANSRRSADIQLVCALANKPQDAALWACAPGRPELRLQLRSFLARGEWSLAAAQAERLRQSGCASWGEEARAALSLLWRETPAAHLSAAQKADPQAVDAAWAGLLAVSQGLANHPFWSAGRHSAHEIKTAGLAAQASLWAEGLSKSAIHTPESSFELLRRASSAVASGLWEADSFWAAAEKLGHRHCEMEAFNERAAAQGKARSPAELRALIGRGPKILEDAVPRLRVAEPALRAAAARAGDSDLREPLMNLAAEGDWFTLETWRQSGLLRQSEIDVEGWALAAIAQGQGKAAEKILFGFWPQAAPLLSDSAFVERLARAVADGAQAHERLLKAATKPQEAIFLIGSWPRLAARVESLLFRLEFPSPGAPNPDSQDAAPETPARASRRL